jgi:hypothetical protein
MITSIFAGYYKYNLNSVHYIKGFRYSYLLVRSDTMDCVPTE